MGRGGQSRTDWFATEEEARDARCTLHRQKENAATSEYSKALSVGFLPRLSARSDDVKVVLQPAVCRPRSAKAHSPRNCIFSIL
ncbi:hypothetical protein Q4577_23695 [Marinovum sp. 2_MG-2023]|uniref:hypothetical protein n=1 Tax=unclassified Marinovum TaxID=2647166 RepID=UPI0026E3CE3F|nr:MULTISPECIES: hypothetical protein [unclassified Marinovum]MDO6733011.1 hypothetical protein [Marinovum sp. 2_MG-2023]MDO6782275.1 hypothetical protein [Marinovum sp. 1_MG-2023]